MPDMVLSNILQPQSLSLFMIDSSKQIYILTAIYIKVNFNIFIYM
jgi:hypothetical protein